MLADLARNTVEQDHAMLRVDLDGTDFILPAVGFPERVILHKLHIWAGPTQVRKEIAPMLMKLVEVKPATKAGRDAQKQAGDHFLEELRTIANKMDSTVFKRAADLFEQNREAILTMVTAARKKADEAYKAHWKATKKAPTEEVYNRAAFYLDGRPLQDHPDYIRYWREVYEKARQDKGRSQITSDGVVMEVITNAPCKWDNGPVLGTNIPVDDKEYIRWGYRQNTGMWMSEQEFVERTNGMNLVPKHPISIGKTRVYVALVSPTAATSSNKYLTSVMAAAMQGADDGTAWLPQHLLPFWQPASPAAESSNLAADLRLAIFTTEKVRMRMLTYEPMNEGRMVQAIYEFRKHYENRTIFSLLACQQAPKEDPVVTAPDIQTWVQRIFTRKPATLLEATRALNRWLIESRSNPNKYRAASQSMIMEDYMSSVPIDPQYASLGVFLSVCADIAFQTGQLSPQNKADNAHAHARKERFLSRFMTQATRTPSAAVAQVAQEINRFLGAIPAYKANQKHYLRDRFNQALQDTAMFAGSPTQHQQVSLWKGFTQHQHQLVLERIERRDQARTKTEATTPSESTN